jgi:thiol-disulfide isomerase/thioredoxin
MTNIRTKSAMTSLSIGFLLALSLLVGCASGGDSDSPPALQSSSGESSQGTDATQSAITDSPAPTETERRDYPPAPPFHLENIAGGAIDLAELRGKVVLIDFWATWCGPCLRGIPHLNELQKELGDEGVVILGVSVDRGARGVPPIEHVRRFMKDPHRTLRLDPRVPIETPTYPVLMEDGAIDREGRFRGTYVGLQPPTVFRREIERLLAESPAGGESDEPI